MKKDDHTKSTAIIVAAGYGSRMKSIVAKQYLDLSGIPVVARAIIPFEKAKSINEIILVVPPDDISFVNKNIVHSFGFEKVARVVGGGAQRQDSVREAFPWIGDEVEIIVIHDGVRPFVEVGHIDTVIREARIYGAATMGIPVTDTLKKVGKDYGVMLTIDRTMLWRTQTPQAFKGKIIKEAYARAYEDGFYGTDDASLVERMGIKVRMVRGAPTNIKITTKDDIQFALQIVQEQRRRS